MKCPICGKRLSVYGERCADCGYRIPDREDCSDANLPSPDALLTPENKTPYYEPPNKTRRSKCCCGCAVLAVVPLLLLLIGAVVFGIHVIRTQVISEDFGYYEDVPSHEAPESLPDEAAEGAFSIHDGQITFLSEAWDGGTIVHIPETVDGQTVTALAPGCFRDCTGLTTIVLPDTITHIGMEAFAGCANLRGLLLPAGTVSINANAFAGCVSLEALYVPNSVEHIATGCLDDCAGLMYIFYDGPFEDWNALYSDFITPFTTAICTDNAYFHGAKG